ERIRHPLFGANEYCMVGRVADRRIDPGHVAKLREGTYQLRVSGSYQLRRNLVQAQIVGSQMVADISDITRLDQQIGRHLALDAEVVLVGDRRQLLWIKEGDRSIGLLAQRHCAESWSKWLPCANRKSAAQNQRALRLRLSDRVTGGSGKPERCG